jgi:hypothetical protein
MPYAHWTSTPSSMALSGYEVGQTIMARGELHYAALSDGLDERVRALRARWLPVPRSLGAAGCVEGVPREQRAAVRGRRGDDPLPCGSNGPRRDRLVEAMLHDHQELTERTRELASVREPFEALAAAEGTAAMFALHVGTETQLLIPTLASAEHVSMTALLQSMEQRLGELGRLPAAGPQL